MDPFATTLAVGGLIGESLREGFRDGTAYDAHEGIRAAIATALVHIPRDAFLDKSYLTGLKDLKEMLFARNEASLGENVTRHVSGILTRLVPLGGQSRQVNDMLHGSAVEAVTLTDQMLRTIPGAGLYMPVRRDILGDPVRGRTFGIAAGDAGITEGASINPVKEKLRDLGFSIRNLRRTDPSGFQLTAKQLDRLRELRGKVAVDDTGSTMTQALERLFADPWFVGLPGKEQKRHAVMDVITSFNAPARELMVTEDPDYAAAVIGRRSFRQYVRDGFSHMGAVEAAEADVRAAGLPDPKLRGFVDWLREQ